ncbi:MAG TPA: GAF domain-containing protein [Candidatus Rubrimentiphilum sp.]|nr:GAF domain-containing protein [Candidatus Rubrimentiphilum sp.]
MRQPVARVLVIVALTALAVIYNGGDFLLPWHPFSTYGFSANAAGTITAVDARAAKTGLRVGDRVNVQSLQNWQRLSIGSFSSAPEGKLLHLPLSGGRVVTLQSHQYARSLSDNISDLFAVLAIMIYIIVAATLVLLRPTPATWAFYVFSFYFCFGGTLAAEYAPPAVGFASALIFMTSQAASGAALVAFALRFPNTQPQGFGKLFERVLVFFAAPVLALFSIVTFSRYIFEGRIPSPWVPALANGLVAAMTLAGAIILVARYVMADNENRNRLRWVVGAFTVAFLPLIVLGFIENVAGILPEVTIINVAQVWLLLAPAAVAYTVLKHRLYDIRLVFSRALLYAVITSVIVGLIALVDWGLGRWLAQSRFALAFELALAVFLGVALTSVHRRLERFLNGVIFRAQTLALKALDRFALETDLIADAHHLLQQAYEALRTRLDNEYAAIYTIDGSSYALVTPNPSTPGILASHDFAVLRLRRWHEPFECDDPGHPLRGALLLPMSARGELVGFIACGPKRDRTHYLPEEVQTLSSLAHRVGSAFALLTLAGTIASQLPSAPLEAT